MTIGTVLSSLLAIVLSLAFVIALAWGGLYLMRRFQDGSFGKLVGQQDTRNLRFIRALPIGPRERLVLIEIEGEEMLLGVTAHSISRLREWPAPDSTEASIGAADYDAEQMPSDAPKGRPRFRLRMSDEGQI